MNYSLFRHISLRMISTACLLAAVSVAAQTTSQSIRKQDSKTHENQPQSGTHSEASRQQLRVSEQEMEKHVSDINKASKLIGTEVKNRQDETLGKISDLAIDLNSGKVGYAVLSSGGVLGIGGKLIAVPLQALTAKPGEEYLVIDADKERIDQAPGFADNNWPSLDQAQHRTVGLAANARTERQTEAVGGTVAHFERTSGADSDREAQDGTVDSTTRVSGGEAGGAIFDLRQFATADTSTLQGKRVILSDAKVHRVYGDRLFTVSGPQGDEILVRSERPLQKIQAGQTVRISGTIGKTPANLQQMGIDQSSADHLQGKAICIFANEVVPSQPAR